MFSYNKTIKHSRWTLVAQACNPSYSGGRRQKANSSQNPSLKIPNT
jgi:hypothetical protein